MRKVILAGILVAILMGVMVSTVSAQGPVYNPPAYQNPYSYNQLGQSLTYEVQYSYQRTQYDFQYAKQYANAGYQSVSNYANTYRQTGVFGAVADPLYYK